MRRRWAAWQRFSGSMDKLIPFLTKRHGKDQQREKRRSRCDTNQCDAKFTLSYVSCNSYKAPESPSLSSVPLTPRLFADMRQYHAKPE